MNYDKLDRFIDDIFWPLVIIVLVALMGLAIITTAHANSLVTEPTKDWCRGEFGHDRPMDYCSPAARSVSQDDQ